MKFVLFLIFLIFLIFITSNRILCDIYEYRSFEERNKDQQQGYASVLVTCDLGACWKSCSGIGSLDCSWSIAFENPASCACLFERAFFGDGDAQSMFDYAENQISAENYEGTYSNNLLKASGIIYYRTVVWEFDVVNEEKYIKVDMTKITPE